MLQATRTDLKQGTVYKLQANKGQSLLEVIIAVTIFALVASAIITLSLGGFLALNQGGDRTRAEALAQEGIEAVRSIWNLRWNDSTYSTSSVVIIGGGWEFLGEGTTEQIDEYTRVISFSDVCRDGSDDITPCPGTYTDVSTKQVTVEVIWESRPGTMSSVRRTAYLTNWDSRDWIQTDWFGGGGQVIWSDTTRYDSDDGNIDISIVGEIKLVSSPGGPGSGPCPGLVSSDDRDKEASDVFVFGNYAYIGTKKSGAEGEFYVYDISDPANIILLNSLEINGDVNHIYVAGNYAYLATDHEDRELIAVDISNPASLNIDGFYNLPNEAKTVFAEGTTVYVGTKNDHHNDDNDDECGDEHDDHDDHDDDDDDHDDDEHHHECDDDDDDEGDGDDEGGCGECSGKVTDLTLRYDGSQSAVIKVVQKKDSVVVFENTVVVGGQFSFVGTYNDTLGTEIIIYVDNVENTRIHTSCSQPIGVGLVSGDFTVMAGESKNGGDLCPMGDGDDNGDDSDDDDSDEDDHDHDDEFYVLNALNISNITLDDSSEIGGDIYDIFVSGDYAYLATTNNDKEFIVYDVSTPTDVSEIDGKNLADDAKGVFVDSDKAYVVTKNNGGAENFFIYDVSNPAVSITLLGSLDLGTDNNKVAVSGNYAFVTGEKNDAELRMVDVSSPVNPLLSYSFDLGDEGNGVAFQSGYIFVSAEDDHKEFQIFAFPCPPGGDEVIYAEGTGSGWHLSDSDGHTETDANNTFLPYNGVKSLLINFFANGWAKFTKSFSTADYSSLDFYLNTVSPWAFAVYGDNGGEPHHTTSVANYTYGNDFKVNNSAFTDFPSPDMHSFKALAQSTSSYIYAGGSNYTLDEEYGDISVYEGKLVYVEFSNTGKRLKLKFDEEPGPFNVSFVTNGKIELDEYHHTVLSSADTSYPVLLSENKEIKFKKNNDMTVYGLIYTGYKVKGPWGGGRITLYGAIVAGVVNNDLKNFTITYNTDFNANPPIYFSPDYYGQTFDISASSGNAVSVSGYLTSALDKDPATWQYVSVPLSDMGIASTTVAYFKFNENMGSDQPTVFVDDMTVIWSGSGGSYVSSGYLISSAFDMGSASTVNTIEWDETLPVCAPSCEVKFQVRTAPDSGGAPGTWTSWYGAGGVGTYFNTSAGMIIPTDLNGNQWVRYKVILSGDTSDTPVLEEVRINYK